MKAAICSLIVSGVCLTTTPSSQQDQRPVFRASTDAVLVNVSVRSGRRPVLGLEKTDFELLDSGVPQEIAVATLETVPLDLALLLDLSGSVQGNVLAGIKRAVQDTVKLLRPEDRFSVISVSHVLHEHHISNLADANILATLAGSGGTALYDALTASMMRAPSPGRRQLIIAYTDGDDASSFIDPARALLVAGLTDAPVHVLLPGTSGAVNRPIVATGMSQTEKAVAYASSSGRDSASVDQAERETVLNDIVRRTGGTLVTFQSDSSVTSELRRILDEFRTSYLLRYVPVGVPRQGWHDLSIRVTRQGHFDVRARRGYEGS